MAWNIESMEGSIVPGNGFARPGRPELNPEETIAHAPPIGQKLPRVNADGSVVLINVPSGVGVGGCCL